jgi:hypothetical protein
MEGVPMPRDLDRSKRPRSCVPVFAEFRGDHPWDQVPGPPVEHDDDEWVVILTPWYRGRLARAKHKRKSDSIIGPLVGVVYQPKPA